MSTRSSSTSSSDEESAKKATDMGEANAEEDTAALGRDDNHETQAADVSTGDKRNVEVSNEAAANLANPAEEKDAADDESSDSSSPSESANENDKAEEGSLPSPVDENERNGEGGDSEQTVSPAVAINGDVKIEHEAVVAERKSSTSSSDDSHDKPQNESEEKVKEGEKTEVVMEGATAAVHPDADDGFDRHSVNSSVKSEESRTNNSLTGDCIEMHDSGVSSAHEVEDRLSEQQKLDSFSNASTKSVESSEVSVSPIQADDTDDATLKRPDNADGDISPAPEAEVTLRKKNTTENGGARPKERNSRIRNSFRNTLNFFRKIPEKLHHKKQPKEPPPLPREMYAGIRVEGLPQHFVTKYLGKQSCKGLFGMEHIREPVDTMVRAVNQMKKGEDLPLTQTMISPSGIESNEHPKNRAKNFEPVSHPIQTISYGVQDTRYPRVFALITVSDLKAVDKVTNCHAYVCNSPISARKMAMTLQLAFREYKIEVKEKERSFYLRADRESKQTPGTSADGDETKTPDNVSETIAEEKEKEEEEEEEVGNNGDEKENEDSGIDNEKNGDSDNENEQKEDAEREIKESEDPETSAKEVEESASPI